MTRRRLLGAPSWQHALLLALGAAFGLPLLLVLLRDRASLPAVAGLALLLALLVRVGRTAVELRGDVLVVRNVLRTWRLVREQVDGVAVGAGSGWRGGAAWSDALLVRLVDGRLVVADASRDELGLDSSRETVLAAERAVRAWLLGRPEGEEPPEGGQGGVVG